VAPGPPGQPLRCPRCGDGFTVRVQEPALSSRPTVVETPPRLDIGAATSAGRVRVRNEDSFLVQHLSWSTLDQRHELALLLVADGMGGHEAGDRASGLVVRAVGAATAPLLGGALSGQVEGPDADSLAAAVDHALQEANRAVFRKSQSDPACKGMGAAVGLALVWNGLTHLAHVGDCRIYHHRGGRLTQLTRDQTVVARLLEMGQLTPEQAEMHPSRHEITQAVGSRAELAPSRHDLALAAGDWLLLACDGLHEHLDAAQVQECIARSAPSASHLAGLLVEQVNQRGGSDNCTVIAVHCVS
jgi:protein phosphatase